jgi:hypothetical protein
MDCYACTGPLTLVLRTSVGTDADRHKNRSAVAVAALRAGSKPCGSRLDMCKAVLSAMTVKTDRGVTQLLRIGWFRSVDRTSPTSQQVGRVQRSGRQDCRSCQSPLWR